MEMKETILKTFAEVFGEQAYWFPIIIHCSATRAEQDITAADIESWHRAHKKTPPKQGLCELKFA